ncbi:MAG: plasmid pRiA4b ORF-3 family protein [Limisphaerales bacterium]
MISRNRPIPGQTRLYVYELQIVLDGSKPPLWRQLLVPGDATLGWLHAVIQVAMGWTNSHMHHFLTREARYCDLRHNEEGNLGPTPDRDEREAQLWRVFPRDRTQLVYEYDFGDSWRHTITRKKNYLMELSEARVPVCLGGARACPPEDCGGIWGFQEMLKALRDSKHPQHATMKEWLGRPFPVMAFDLDGINGALRRLKWPRVTGAQLRKVLMTRDRHRE